MLTENDVVDAMCRYLETQGYSILERRTTKEKGIDVVALNPKNSCRLLVEAKGATSADSNSKNYGAHFSSQQIRTHTSRAIATATELSSQHPDDQIGIALPASDGHIKSVTKSKAVLQRLGIAVYLVKENFVKVAW